MVCADMKSLANQTTEGTFKQDTQRGGGKSGKYENKTNDHLPFKQYEHFQYTCKMF